MPDRPARCGPDSGTARMSIPKGRGTSMKPAYPMIGLAFLGACLSVQAQDGASRSRPARHSEEARPDAAPGGSSRRRAGHRGPGRGVHQGLQRGRRRGHRRDLHARGPRRRREGRTHPGPRRHPRPVRRVVQGEPREHDRPRGQLPAVPRPGDGARGGPGDDHAGQGGRGPRDLRLHRHLRQGRRPLAPGRRPRRTGEQPHPPRPSQGAGVAGRESGSTRARTRSSSRPASGPTTATSWSASSPSRCRASP